MKDVSFGQYYPVASPIHRLDPRFKLVLVIAYIVMIFFAETYTAYLGCLLFVFVVAWISRVPLGKVLRSVRPLIFIIVFTLVINLFFHDGPDGTFTFPLFGTSVTLDNRIWDWGAVHLTWSGIDFAVKMAFRLALLVMGPALLTLTTTPMELTDAIESLLHPLTWVHFPVHSLAMIMSIALRLIPTITEETDKIILAQKARCADFDSGNLFKKARSLLPVLIPLFVSSLRRADELADAMDSRCYRGAKGRTKMKKLKTHARDFVALAVTALLMFALLLLKYNWFGWGWIVWVL